MASAKCQMPNGGRGSGLGDRESGRRDQGSVARVFPTPDTRHPTPLLRQIACLLAVCAIPLLTSCLQDARPADDYIGPALDRISAQGVSQPARDKSLPLPTTMPVGASQPELLSRVEPPAAGPLRLTVQNAVLLAIQNNQALAVSRINPLIQQTFETQQIAVFDPLIAGQIAYSRSVNGPGVAPAAPDEPLNTVNGDVGVSTRTVQGGTVGVNLTSLNARADGGAGANATRLSLELTQSLLRGAGVEVNLASIRQARLDTLSSQYELRGFAEQLVADVQIAYWNYVLAQRQIEIFTKSRDVATSQRQDTLARVRAGTGAENLDLPAADAEVALREEGLIDAMSNAEQARLRLIRLINPPTAGAGDRGSGVGGRMDEGRGARDAGARDDAPALSPTPDTRPPTPASPWDRKIEIVNQLVVPRVTLDDVRGHVAVAMKMRPDLNQARLQVQRGDLEIVKTRNGLLPRLDLFMTLGKTGYAESFSHSLGDFFGRRYDLLAGVRYEQSPLNRDASAQNRRAALTREQAEESVANLAQLVEVDVRSAYEELIRTGEQVRATKATLRLQARTLEAERTKLRLGNSTNLQVGQAERDMLSAEINEAQAMVNYLNAFVDLFRVEGSLLVRMGIQAPGVSDESKAP